MYTYKRQQTTFIHASALVNWNYPRRRYWGENKGLRYLGKWKDDKPKSNEHDEWWVCGNQQWVIDKQGTISPWMDWGVVNELKRNAVKEIYQRGISYRSYLCWGDREAWCGGGSSHGLGGDSGSCGTWYSTGSFVLSRVSPERSYYNTGACYVVFPLSDLASTFQTITYLGRSLVSVVFWQ